MARYIAVRLVLIIPTLLVASLLIFFVLRILPGDVVLVILSGAPHTVEVRETLREELGLNDSFPVQYGRWLWSMLNGEFGGRSLENRDPIRGIVARQLPVTSLLTFYVVLLSVFVSVPLGIAAAVRKSRWIDYLIRIVTLAGLSIPGVWIALIVILLLLIVFRWFPPVIYTGLFDDPWNHLQIMVWPVLILSWHYSSHLVRVARSAMIEVLGGDHITAARGKGLKERVIMLRHAVPGILIPVVTMAGLQFGTLIGGALVIETVFGLPGIGRGLVHAALARDFPIVQSIALLLVLFTLVFNLVIDLLYTAIDPRIGKGSR